VGRETPKGTSTSAFGVGRRENHDASDFYARFRPPTLSDSEHVHGPVDLGDPLRCKDARDIDLPDDSVALVVTSPPYFAGKEYEAALGRGHIPATYLDYLQMLRDVFAECARVLEPGGRMAINVANLGRKPYRSLAADIVRILEDDLGLLLRGEVIWVKADGASGSCAWGSYKSPANPVLRDVTERVIVASKGRFDRALSASQRRDAGLPHRATTTADEFMEATLDLWRLQPESAKRVGHPAPFPVELPQRLIELYTYEGDLVLDPFLGSGTTAVAAQRTGRAFVGYDTDPEYIELARHRLSAEIHDIPATATAFDPGVDSAGAAAEALVRQAGFTVVDRKRSVTGLGLVVDLVATDAVGDEWFFDVSGSLAVGHGGLARGDILWRTLGKAAVIATQAGARLVLITTEVPSRRSALDRALRAVGPAVVFDVIELGDEAGAERLRSYAAGAGST
jgi:site-specific DNA-methyltransferase (adenine-specific)